MYFQWEKEEDRESEVRKRMRESKDLRIKKKNQRNEEKEANKAK